MKQVEISKTLLKEYTDKELIHYISENLKRIAVTATTEKPEWKEVNYGAITVDIQHLSAILSAVDERMNGKKDVNVVL